MLPVSLRTALIPECLWWGVWSQVCAVGSSSRQALLPRIPMEMSAVTLTEHGCFFSYWKKGYKMTKFRFMFFLSSLIMLNILPSSLENSVVISALDSLGVGI